MAKKQQKEDARPNSVSCHLAVRDDGNVAIQFSELVREMVFTSEQAKQLGMGFIEMGTRAEYVLRFGASVNEQSQVAMPSRKM